jgi:hypothetical protein
VQPASHVERVTEFFARVEHLSQCVTVRRETDFMRDLDCIASLALSFALIARAIVESALSANSADVARPASTERAGELVALAFRSRAVDVTHSDDASSRMETRRGVPTPQHPHADRPAHRNVA